MPTDKERALEIARELRSRLVCDIEGRKGLGHEWLRIDESVIENDIYPEWDSMFAAAILRERIYEIEHALSMLWVGHPLEKRLARFRAAAAELEADRG